MEIRGGGRSRVSQIGISAPWGSILRAARSLGRRGSATEAAKPTFLAEKGAPQRAWAGIIAAGAGRQWSAIAQNGTPEHEITAGTEPCVPKWKFTSASLQTVPCVPPGASPCETVPCVPVRPFTFDTVA
jgi:hypothetical protein